MVSHGIQYRDFTVDWLNVVCDYSISGFGPCRQKLSELDGVDAIYLSGSLAEKTEDQYSDIDLRVVIADVAYESVRALREQLPTTWGPFLFHQTVADNLTVTYYHSLTKVDVFYYPASSISPGSTWERKSCSNEVAPFAQL